MGRLAIGSLVAAVAMFVLGFVFYGTPLMQMGFAVAAPEAQGAVQAALRDLSTGTYFIPSGESAEATAAYAAGPVAMVKVNSGGFAMMDPMTFVDGYLHMALSAFLLGLALWGVRDRVADFGSRAKLVLGLALAMAVFTRLGDPIWFHTDWRNALYIGVADFISLSTAGLILARWFVPGVARTAAAMPAAAE